MLHGLALVHWSTALSWYPFCDLSEHLPTGVTQWLPAWLWSFAWADNSLYCPSISRQPYQNNGFSKKAPKTTYPPCGKKLVQALSRIPVEVGIWLDRESQSPYPEGPLPCSAPHPPHKFCSFFGHLFADKGVKLKLLLWDSFWRATLSDFCEFRHVIFKKIFHQLPWLWWELFS